MQYIGAKVGTICTGMAASMGAVLLVAGEKGMRAALPHSRVMIPAYGRDTGTGLRHRDNRPRDIKVERRTLSHHLRPLRAKYGEDHR